ncbi:MAG: hypothetical protein LBJ10_12415 [Clostridiales bacterium]|jgi:hypothetical protein|nr:hypothetical protein [Clostridiales bacterium]
MGRQLSAGDYRQVAALREIIGRQRLCVKLSAGDYRQVAALREIIGRQLSAGSGFA